MPYLRAWAAGAGREEAGAVVETVLWIVVAFVLVFLLSAVLARCSGGKT